jgi:arylsulfatase A
LMAELEAQMTSFPAHVGEAYTKLKQDVGDITTPPGASPRPFGAPVPPWAWEPEDMRRELVKE